MGLDTVELVMTVEETFDITIPDAHAEKIQTVGDLYRYVLYKTGCQGRETPRCLSAAAFYRLRRGLMRSFRVPRREIRPEAAMEALIPAMDRKSEWERLGDSLGWRLPWLVRPGWVWHTFLGLVVIWLAMMLIAWARLARFAPEALVFPVVGFWIGAALMGVVLYRLTRPFAVHFSSATVREVIPKFVSLNFGTICRIAHSAGNRQDIWEVVRAIVAEVAGVSPDRVTESTSFVNDLGMD